MHPMFPHLAHRLLRIGKRNTTKKQYKYNKNATKNATKSSASQCTQCVLVQHAGCSEMERKIQQQKNNINTTQMQQNTKQMQQKTAPNVSLFNTQAAAQNWKEKHKGGRICFL